MKVTSRYTVAIQLLLILRLNPNVKITSNTIAYQAGVDPVIVRHVMSELKRAKFLDCRPGPGGISLLADLSITSLYDIYCAVSDTESTLFKFYETPRNADIQIIQINKFTEEHLLKAENAMFERMRSCMIEEICNSIKQNLSLCRILIDFVP